MDVLREAGAIVAEFARADRTIQRENLEHLTESTERGSGEDGEKGLRRSRDTLALYW
jgi:hypothetical protein